jgi:hypothetical protein
MPEPIEIRPGDIIKRPLTLPTGSPAPGGGFNMKSIKGYLEQIKEMKKTLEDMGIDLGDLGLKLGGSKKQAAPMPEVPATTTATQIKNFLKFLQAMYGDITVNELLIRLKTDYGEWKISSFTKGGLV